MSSIFSPYWYPKPFFIEHKRLEGINNLNTKIQLIVSDVYGYA